VAPVDDYFQKFTQKSERAQGAATDQRLPPWYLSLVAKWRWRQRDDQRGWILGYHSAPTQPSPGD
jgi:hypothetical protein